MGGGACSDLFCEKKFASISFIHAKCSRLHLQVILDVKISLDGES